MHFPPLIQDLAIILGVAAIVTFLFKLIKQPVVLGYIIAGLIVGPYTPAIFSVSDTENIKIWAELGVIFLMFNLGLEFSFRRLMKVGMSAAITAILQIFAMLFLGLFAAKSLGWNNLNAIFLGCMIAISSTTIIIKALEELNLNSKKFAEIVYGILIVEDLAAILMLVALTNIATSSQISGVDLLLAALKLGMVVAAWFIVGMFVVPRFVRSVGKHGNDEMLTVLSIGLCLALVALAAKFHYSVALGAFIMGSILAESSEVKRIEHLTQSLKDIFGAVFFVSIGMLLNPKVIVEEWLAVTLISSIIIIGKFVSVSIGSLLTGQSIRSSLLIGLTMAQIGEFSFIIATLGLSYEVLNPSIYPIIVAASLVTTFATPYLIHFADPLSNFVEKKIPNSFLLRFEKYRVWIQRSVVTQDNRKKVLNGLMIWVLNAVVMISCFTIGAEKLKPALQAKLFTNIQSTNITWAVAFVLSSPSMWAMMNIFAKSDVKFASIKILTQVLTIALLGLLSIEYFAAFTSLGVTLILCVGFLILFRKQIGLYYRWLENEFKSGFSWDVENRKTNDVIQKKFVPWDAHLIPIKIPAFSSVVGKSFQELKLREKFSINVVVLKRDDINLVAPQAKEIVYPGDELLCFATDSEIDTFKEAIQQSVEPTHTKKTGDDFELRTFRVFKTSALENVSIDSSKISEHFTCIVVGIERNNTRLQSPSASLVFQEHDLVWIVGETTKLHALSNLFEPKISDITN